MALRLHQNLVNCPTCGEYLWEVWSIHTTNETLDETICPKCRPKAWNEMLLNAVKFETLSLDEKRNVIEKPHKG